MSIADVDLSLAAKHKVGSMKESIELLSSR